MKNRFNFEAKIIKFVTKKKETKKNEWQRKGKILEKCLGKGCRRASSGADVPIVCISPLCVIYCEPDRDQATQIYDRGLKMMTICVCVSVCVC